MMYLAVADLIMQGHNLPPQLVTKHGHLFSARLSGKHHTDPRNRVLFAFVLNREFPAQYARSVNLQACYPLLYRTLDYCTS